MRPAKVTAASVNIASPGVVGVGVCPAKLVALLLLAELVETTESVDDIFVHSVTMGLRVDVVGFVILDVDIDTDAEVRLAIVW